MRNKKITNQDFELFKSNMCHFLKESGELEFIKQMLVSNNVEKYWLEGNVLYSLYLLAMIDYLSNKNDIPLYKKYSYLRTQKLKEPFYPLSAKMLFFITDNKNTVKRYYYENAIPEFVKHNILEGDVFNVK